MEIRQLKYFISTARYLNFTKAAQECFVVQTTITHQIAALEKELGIKLFERDSRSVTLTEPGKAFLRNALEIVRKSDEALKEIQYIKNHYINSLQIGYWGNLVQWFLPDLLRQYRQAYPRTRVGLIQGNASELIELLETGKLDFIFCCYFEALEDIDWIDSMVLYTDDLSVLVPVDHPLASQDMVFISQLKDELLITFEGTGAEDLQKRIKKEGYLSNIAITQRDHESIVTLVEAGYGITFCANRSIPGHKPNIRAVKVSGDFQQVKIMAYWSRKRAKSSVKNIITLLKQSSCYEEKS